MKNKIEISNLCTATIIHKYWVITVKECLVKHSEKLKVMRILVGTSDIREGGIAHRISLKVGHKT